MTLLTPPGFLQAGSYSALLDRMNANTSPVLRDFGFLHRARQGFFASRYPTYTNPANMDISVSACSGIVANTFVTDGGEYRFVNPTSLTVTLAASSPTLNRIDIVGFRVFDNFYDASGQNQIVAAVVQGAGSAGAPSAPALPNSFIPIVQALVNANATTPTSLTDLRQYTATEQSRLLIPSATARTAIGTPYEGLVIDRTDRDWAERWDGTAWRVQNQPALVTSTADRDAAITNPSAGTLAMIGASGQTYRYTGSAWTPHLMYRDEIILGAPAANIQFSNIPSTLRRLVLCYAARSNAAATTVVDIRMQINGNSGPAYRGNVVTNVQVTPNYFMEDSPIAYGTVGHALAQNEANNIYSGGEIHFEGWSDYASHANMTWLSEAHSWRTSVESYMSRSAGIYFAAGPYTSITLIPSAGSFTTSSRFTLYGWE